MWVCGSRHADRTAPAGLDSALSDLSFPVYPFCRKADSPGEITVEPRGSEGWRASRWADRRRLVGEVDHVREPLAAIDGHHRARRRRPHRRWRGVGHGDAIVSPLGPHGKRKHDSTLVVQTLYCSLLKPTPGSGLQLRVTRRRIAVCSEEIYKKIRARASWHPRATRLGCVPDEVFGRDRWCALPNGALQDAANARRRNVWASRRGGFGSRCTPSPASALGADGVRTGEGCENGLAGPLRPTAG